MTRTKAMAVVVTMGLCLGLLPAEASGQTSTTDQGSRVKVLLNDGTSRKLTFIGLTQTELLVQDLGKPVERIALSRVKSVRKTTYIYTILLAAAGGVTAGVMAHCSWACAGEGTDQNAMSAGMLFGAMGAAGGAALGYFIDSRPSRGTLVYQSKPKTSVGVSPVIAPHRVGAVVSVRW